MKVDFTTFGGRDCVQLFNHVIESINERDLEVVSVNIVNESNDINPWFRVVIFYRTDMGIVDA